MSKLPEAIKPEKYFDKVEILRDALLQIRKDFDVYDTEIDLESFACHSFEALVSEIQPLVEKLLDNNTEKFFATLYRIDIQESVANELAAERNFEKLSAVILKREIEKVLLRKWYAGKIKG